MAARSETDTTAKAAVTNDLGLIAITFLTGHRRYDSGPRAPPGVRQEKAVNVTTEATFSGGGGMVFHVLNRGVGRRLLFTKDEDFLAFERVVEETLRTRRMQLCAYCLMPNHWHFVVWPERDGDL
jgi:hypothetical protein